MQIFNFVRRMLQQIGRYKEDFVTNNDERKFTFLHHLNPRKALGVDSISPQILRLVSPVLAEKVTKLINFCILNGSLPSE